MSLKITRQSKKTVTKIKHLELLTKSGIEHALFTSAQEIRNTAEDQILNGIKTGRIYTIYKNGRRVRHQSSAPRETHAEITGKLRRSIGWRISWRELDIGYGYQTRERAPDYAEYVEFGTPKKQMKPRPTLKNAIKSNEANIVKNLRDEIGKRLEGAGGLIR